MSSVDNTRSASPDFRILVILGCGIGQARRLPTLLPKQREQADEVHRSVYHGGGRQKDVVTGCENRSGPMRNVDDRLQLPLLVRGDPSEDAGRVQVEVRPGEQQQRQYSVDADLTCIFKP